MVVQQLEMCSKSLAEGSGALPAVRCNYGTAILPSLFGAEIFLMDREIDTLPACRPLEGGADAVKRLLDRGVPDLETGQGEIVFRMGEYFGQLLREFPGLAEHVHIYHPDLQGPMNVCEMLWGGSIYVDFYDKPDLIKGFLSLITETYIRFMRRWEEVVARPSSLVARTDAQVRQLRGTRAERRATRLRRPLVDAAPRPDHGSQRRRDESLARHVRGIRPALRSAAARRAWRRGDPLLRPGRSLHPEGRRVVRGPCRST